MQGQYFLALTIRASVFELIPRGQEVKYYWSAGILSCLGQPQVLKHVVVFCNADKVVYAEREAMHGLDSKAIS